MVSNFTENRHDTGTLMPLAEQCTLPQLVDGFVIQLFQNEWGALFPRHHMMWVSPDLRRVRDFVHLAKNGSLNYAELLTDRMKQSFESYYSEPRREYGKQNAAPCGELLNSSICFLTTNDCNLGCKYCFSGAQPKKFGAIPWGVAKAAVDVGVRNAVLNRLRTGSGELCVRFFGGGEPTEYWQRFKEIVDYARAEAGKATLRVLVATITNGQIDNENFAWFGKSVDELTVSMDGPPDIQNAQRPLSGGRPSFDKSWAFLSSMADLDRNIKAIRITVTAESLPRMVEIAEFFWSNLPKAYPLQFEPVYFSEVGRQNCEMPGALAFVEELRRVEEMARQRHEIGRRHSNIMTASRPLVIRANAFCDSLEGKGLFVTPDGYLSLCSEISSPADPRASEYLVGRYNPANARFHVSDEGISKMRCGPPWWCRGCYAQFSCRGGCEPRSRNPNKQVRKWWCQMVRENLRGTWSDVRADKVQARARIGNRFGEELIWLPIWTAFASMDA